MCCCHNEVTVDYCTPAKFSDFGVICAIVASHFNADVKSPIGGIVTIYYCSLIYLARFDFIMEVQ